MEFLMTHSRQLIYCAVILTFLVAGCSKKFTMPRESLGRESGWQFHRSNIQSTGEISGAFGGKLNIVWEQKTGTRPSGPLTLGNGYLIYPGSRKKVKIYDSSTGSYSGYIKTKGHTPTGMILSDSLAYYVDGPTRNVLHCVNLLNRHALWTAPVKDAVSGSIIINNKLILGLTEGTILAYNTGNGVKEWFFEAKERLLAPPSANQMLLVQSGDKGTVFFVNSENGNEVTRFTLNQPILVTAAIDDLVYLVDMPGHIYALNGDSGTIVWQDSVTGPVWSSPTVNKNMVCIAGNSGVFTAFDSKTGQRLWNYDAKEVIKSSPIIVGDYVLFGTMSGKLYSLKTADGALVSQRDFAGAIAQSPISDGQFIYVATDAGELVCVGENREATALHK